MGASVQPVQTSSDGELKRRLVQLKEAGATDAEMKQYVTEWDGHVTRVRTNGLKMRSQGAPEDEVRRYLAQEDERLNMPATDWVEADRIWEEAQKRDAATKISMRNIVRSLGQGASFSMSDEKFVPSFMRADRNAEKAFKAEHPIADFAAKAIGGLAAPAVAVAAAPSALGVGTGLAALRGAALLGGATGLLTGVGEGETPEERLKGAAEGAIGGAVGGAALHGAGQLVGKGIGAVANKLDPARRVAQATAPLRSAIERRYAELDRVAPGAASVAVVAEPMARSRSASSALIPFVKKIGHSPEAARVAVAYMTRQKAMLTAASRRIGDKMDAAVAGKTIPLDETLVPVLAKVDAVLGKKAPEIHMPGQPPTIPPTSEVAITAPLKRALDATGKLLGKEHIPQPTGTGADARVAVSILRDKADLLDQLGRQLGGDMEKRAEAARVDLLGAVRDARRASSLDAVLDQAGGGSLEAVPYVKADEAREALSRLRFVARQMDKHGMDANGATKNEVIEAKNALQDVLNLNLPKLAALDKRYAIVSEAKRSNDALLEEAKRSASRHAASRAYRTIPGSGRDGTHRPRWWIADAAMSKLANRGGVADAVAQYVTKPGVPPSALYRPAVKPSPAKAKAGLVAAAYVPTALRGLLFDQ